MSWGEMPLYVRRDIYEGSVEIANEHLEFYRDLLIAESRLDIFDLRSRNDFLVAVGARALMNTSYHPQKVARDAIVKGAGVLAMEAVHSDMAEWSKQEWEDGISLAFHSFQPRPHEIPPEDDTYVDYLQVLESLRARGRYPLRFSGVSGSVSSGRRYEFSDRGRRAKASAPERR